jgi:uncharacterized protein (TIGR02996 family)
VSVTLRPATTARATAPFVAAIAARPDDDLPRLIFADWLDDSGESDRAEFIRLHCAAARGDADAAARAAKLEACHRREWLAELPGVYHAEFRRGFAEHLALPASTFLSIGAALRRRTPVRSVALLGAANRLEQLLTAPLLDGLTGLHLTDSRVGDEGVIRLADAACLRDLKNLRLGNTGVQDAGATALACSPHLSGLRTLVLRGNAIGDVGAWDLARSATLRGLEYLDVAENDIGLSGVAALQSALSAVDVSRQRESARWWQPVAPK